VLHRWGLSESLHLRLHFRNILDVDRQLPVGCRSIWPHETMLRAMVGFIDQFHHLLRAFSDRAKRNFALRLPTSTCL